MCWDLSKYDDAPMMIIDYILFVAAVAGNSSSKCHHCLLCRVLPLWLIHTNKPRMMNKYRKNTSLVSISNEATKNKPIHIGEKKFKKEKN